MFCEKQVTDASAGWQGESKFVPVCAIKACGVMEV